MEQALLPFSFHDSVIRLIVHGADAIRQLFLVHLSVVDILNAHTLELIRLDPLLEDIGPEVASSYLLHELVANHQSSI